MELTNRQYKGVVWLVGIFLLLWVWLENRQLK
jgi:hypothetical protein